MFGAHQILQSAGSLGSFFNLLYILLYPVKFEKFLRKKDTASLYSFPIDEIITEKEEEEEEGGADVAVIVGAVAGGVVFVAVAGVAAVFIYKKFCL